MNILLATAVMIAATTSQAAQEPYQEPYQLTLEAHAEVIACAVPRTNLMCFDVQGQRFAINSTPYPIGTEFTVGFTFECDRDENCKVINIRDID